ncbi:MAG: TIGR02301 family protein [Pseudomonadota bacterium]
MMQTASKGTLWRVGALFGITLLSIGISTMSVRAQENSAPATVRPPSVAPYDSRLQRLSEVLGSIHYLRNLCGETSNQWRDQMEGLLAVEKPTPNRRARLIAEFNKGYRSFNSVYTTCTPQALTAVDRYMNEGKALAGEINSRYAE